MKKVSLILSALILMMGTGTAAQAESYVPSRTINLVYDDSGSMIRLGRDYVDTWCQAKYAMEVVAAMLGERDALNVYYMSDYDKSADAPPRLRLKGSRHAAAVAANVDRIHQTITPFGNTPFNAVRKASDDIKTVNTDERWLVVLTDGEFEDGRMSGKQVEEYYAQVVSDKKTKVIMLAMGPQAATIQSDEANGIYFEHAASTADILPKLTSICNRIFQRNALEVVQKNRDYTIEFGVPMKQLIVFAQGRDAKIGEKLTLGEKTFEQSSNVHATYSTQSSKQNPPGAVVADYLNGYVATFDGEFDPGSYKLDVTNAESLEVYYKPNVAINAYLFDTDGKEVTDSADIVNGRYKLEFGFVNASTNAKVTDTSLLGDIEYKSTIVNTAADGTVNKIDAVSGDTITIKEGRIDIDVTARYLEYNTVNTKLGYEVFFRNELVFEIDDIPKYSLTKDGLSSDPIVASVRMKDGGTLIPLNAEQWEAMPLPKVSTEADLGDFEIKKGEPGEFLITPTLGDIDPMKAAAGTYPITVKGGFTRGKSSAAGRGEASFTIRDDITDSERFLYWLENHWKMLLFWFVAAILVIGYIVKKRFPKNFVKHPDVECKNERTYQTSHTTATIHKDRMSAILPYVAETGYVSFGSTGIEKMMIKAHTKSAVLLTNASRFADRSEYDFGKQITRGTKSIAIPASKQIRVKIEQNTYSYQLNKK